MKSGERAKGKPARQPGARRARSSKPRSMPDISPSRASSLSIQPQDVNLNRMLETLKPHDHLCLIYESQEEWRAAVVPFIAMGLRRGEKCTYIVDTSTADEIRKYLGEEGVDVASAEKSGQLSVLHETEAYTREGSFDPDRMIALLISEAEKAIAEGYPALRVTGEMTWVLRGHPGSEKLLEYEAKLNRDFFPKYPCLGICQYDRWKFDPDIIKGVIMTHPLLVRGDRIYHNFYYVPPEEFLNRKRAELEVQHWLNNVEREQRIMDMLRESEERHRTLFERTANPILVIDTEGNYIDANEAALQFLECTREELLTKNTRDYLPPSKQRQMIREHLPLWKSGGRIETEHFVNGKLKTLDLTITPGVWHDKRVVFGVGADITERKRAEERVRHFNLVLRAIRNINQLIARGADRDSLLKGACENFVKTRGYYNAWIALLDESGKLVTAAEAGLGKNFLQMIERLKRGELPYCGRKILKKSGVVVIEDPSAACIDCPLAKDYSGRGGMSIRLEYGEKVYGMLTVSTPGDIALDKEEHSLFEEVAGDMAFALYSKEQEEEHKRVEESLRLSEHNFRDSIENSPFGIRVANEDGKTLYANRALLDIYGYSSVEELEAVPRKQRYTPGSYNEHRERIRKRKRGEHVPLSYEISIVRSDGQARYLLASRGELLWNGEKQFQVVYQDITERKQAEEKYQTIVRTTIDGFWFVDMQGHFLDVNEAYCHLTGYSRDELLNMAITDVEAIEKPEETAKRIRKIKEVGYDRFETRHRCKDGEIIDIGISVNYLPIDGGRMFVFIRDITERKRIEEALVAKQAQLLSIFDSIEAVAYVTDPETYEVLYVNKFTKNLLGTDPTGGRCYKEFQDLDHPCGFCTNDIILKEKGKTYQWEQHNPKVDRDYILFDRIIKWPGERDVRFEFGIDITERKRVEEALRRSEERYRTILSEMQDNYFEVDLAGNLTFFNDSTSNSLGYSAEELMGMSYSEFTASEDIKLVYKAFNKVYRTNRPNKGFLWKVVRKDGTVGFVEATVSPLRNPKGEIIGFRGVGRDITERKRAEEERKQLEQKAQVTSRLASVGEMAAGVAHEINNPLTGVIGYAQLLMDGKDIPSDIRRDLAAINEGAQRVASIVKRLLVFSRQVKPERRDVDINELIESTLALRAYHLRVNNIKVTIQLAPDLPETVADPGQLQQVFLNLVVNAETEMKLARGKGKLLIKTEKVDNTIRISFKDNGPGIAKKNLERIFDPFFTTREVGQGTGLGLSLCHGIVAEHNGKMYAESKLGKGATFVVELPVVTEAEQPKPSEAVVEEPEKVAKARILVVDDEQVIRDFVKRVLAGEGYE
ncbi:MAG: PAS domain S-box protein, partial [Chloroflexi bacterium]|nr:PAS domain S-box protein [Chloroflexota bacterium]